MYTPSDIRIPRRATVVMAALVCSSALPVPLAAYIPPAVTYALCGPLEDITSGHVAQGPPQQTAGRDHHSPFGAFLVLAALGAGVLSLRRS